MTGQEKKGTEQAVAGKTDAEVFCFSRPLWALGTRMNYSPGSQLEVVSVFVLIFNSPNAGQFSAENVSIINVSKTIFVFLCLATSRGLTATKLPGDPQREAGLGSEALQAAATARFSWSLCGNRS